MSLADHYDMVKAFPGLRDVLLRRQVVAPSLPELVQQRLRFL